MQLNSLQANFKTALLSKDHTDFAARAIVRGEIPASARLRIHQNNVVITLTEALKAVYPTIQQFVGNNFFNALAGGFVRNHPPSRGALIAYGEDFPAFLNNFEPARRLPYLADIARLEWARHNAFHAADATPITGSIFADLGPEQIAGLRLRLSPSANLLVSPYPLIALWELAQVEDEPKDTVEIEPAPSHLLIHRPDLEVQILTLTEAAFIFLRSLSEGRNLTQSYEAAAEQDTGFDLQAALTDLMEADVFTAIETEQQ